MLASRYTVFFEVSVVNTEDKTTSEKRAFWYSVGKSFK